jgi:transcriptional regulator with XRE-family HTH domain
MVEAAHQQPYLNTTVLAIMSSMTPAQCRAARALLTLTQQQLAGAAGVSVVTVRQFELGATTPQRATLDVMSRALQAAGIEFIAENGGGPGVRLRTGGQHET